jgi:hypothetical integral membrane protein (TIGR02206 family)
VADPAASSHHEAVTLAAEEFTTYGASHLGAVLVMLLGGLVLVALGRRGREHDPDDRLGKVLAVTLLALTLPLQALYFTPEYWRLDTTLPIQLCDLASFAAAYALWTHRRWAVGLTWYWGLTLTTQAIATPALDSPFPTPIYFLFWGMHIGSVWAAAYLTWGRGIRPGWDTFRTAVAVTAVWAVLVYGFNVLAGTNYGFLNRKPSTASILDLLGPWPWYVLAEIAIIVVAWALVTWPWVRGGRSRAGERPDEGSTPT